MTAYIIRRLAALLVNLFLISMFLFLALNVFVPGDPALTILTETADQEQRDAFNRLHGLDKSIPEQYVRWVSRVLTGNFGISFVSGLSVTDEFFTRLPITMEIMFLSFTFTSIIGTLGGVISAVKQDTIWDYGVRFFAVFAISIPGFLLLTLLLIVPARWFEYAPPFGSTEYLPWRLESLGELKDNLQLMIPPTLILSISTSAILMRLTRTAMLDVLRQDYLRTARSKGLAERTVIVQHAVRNAITTVLTFMGLQIGFLLGGSVILENILALPGLGQWGLQALQFEDLPIFLLFALYASGTLMLVNLLVDLLYAVFDPRIKYS